MNATRKALASFSLAVLFWAGPDSELLGEIPAQGDLMPQIVNARKVARDARARAHEIRVGLHHFPYKFETGDAAATKLVNDERNKTVKALEEAVISSEKIAEALEDQAFYLEVDRYATLAHLDDAEKKFVRAMKPVDLIGRGTAEVLAHFVRTVDQLGLSLEKDFPFMRENLHILAIEDFDHSGRKKALIRVTGGTPGQTLIMLDPYWLEWNAAHRDQDDRVLCAKISLEDCRAEDCPIRIVKTAGGAWRIHVSYDDWPHDSKATTFYRYTSVLEFTGRDFIVVDSAATRTPLSQYVMPDF